MPVDGESDVVDALVVDVVLEAVDAAGVELCDDELTLDGVPELEPELPVELEPELPAELEPEDEEPEDEEPEDEEPEDDPEDFEPDPCELSGSVYCWSPADGPEATAIP